MRNQSPLFLPYAAAVFIVAGPLSAFASAQSIVDAREDIRSTYNFDPATMAFDEQARRAPSLSALWDRYSKSPHLYGDALRTELRAPGQPELLYCDGGMLLLNKSKTPEDQALGITSIQKCSLTEIQHTPYFYTVHALAVRGVDTFDLQARMLTKPKYSVFIVQHALSLGQDYAFLYPFLVQEESAYVPRLIAHLREERDPIAQKSLVRALWYSATPDAEAALQTFANKPGSVSPATEDARKLLESLGTVRQWKADDQTLKRVRSAINVSERVSVPELRAKRRTRMRAISDEALYDLEAYTALIYRRGT